MTRSHSLPWKEKLKAWNTWTAFPTAALAFLEVGTEKANLSQDAFEKIEQFVVFMYEKNSAVTTVNAAWQKLFSQWCKAINTYISTEHQGCHLHQPGDGPRTTMEATMDNTSSGWGLVYEPMHCGCKQDCKTRYKLSVQLPTSHVLPYATLEETAMQTSLMTAFESSSRFCVSCCNFISVQVNLLSPVGTLDYDFWIDSLHISRGFH